MVRSTVRCVTLCWRSAIAVALLAVYRIAAAPQYLPTKGSVWPKPNNQTYHDEYFAFNPNSFRVRISNHRCTLLLNAVQRYIKVMNNYDSLVKKGRKYRPEEVPKDKKFQGLVKELMIKLTNPCEPYPRYGMDESYRLVVKMQSQLESNSIWGVIRGLETFGQLFYLSDGLTQVYINATEISDWPRYAHRGLLLDTARHFISVENVLTTLDAMAMNKLNILHWHIVDDESFPFASDRLPGLSKKGAYHPSMVYTKENITKIINYARDRGIRVVPEFDMPGHTTSWGMSYPEIMVNCTNNNQTKTAVLNPIAESTYKILKTLLNEVQTLFVDEYLHLGGDEVDFDCWQSNSAIQEYMKTNLLDGPRMREMFMKHLTPMLHNKTKLVVYQDVFNDGVSLPAETIVQIWKDDESMLKALRAGHRVVFSASWYMDHLDYSLPRLYLWEPRAAVLRATHDATLAARVVGGEASVWGHLLDDTNIITRVWPRASGVAEVLWSRGLALDASPLGAILALRESRRRLEEHACRMQRAHVPAEPASGPGFCFT